MLFNDIFNNISVISWRSVLLVVETGVPGENHRPVASHSQTLSHNVVSSTPRLSEIRVSEWLLFNANSSNIQLYYGENKLIENEMITRSVLY